MGDLEEKKDPKLCQRMDCKNEAKPLHECPYQADVNNDHEYECNCCADCAYECALDI